ncbi:MAG TPA: DUF3089 domain-containing protein [Longimicrobiales bacterium]|nr:DUF3089 domain-containing protein [Longimicrobiales bacterium]
MTTLSHAAGRMILAAALLAPALVLPAGAAAQSAVPAPAPAPNDYSDGAAWLCRPGRQDACAVDLTTTLVRADGTLTREEFRADPSAPIDCFYVYPTVSTDRTIHSDMHADEAELRVVEQQLARFASVCRLYAPMYRQITIAGLGQLLQRLGQGGEPASLGAGLAYDDVLAAWRHYLANDNGGRGYVLIGHSQGSSILSALIRNEIQGRPVAERMVSALLLGLPGTDSGTRYQGIPPCTSASQARCVIGYNSFRATAPPPANTLFGDPPEPGATGLCTNPAALGGGSGELRAYLSTTGTTIAGARQAPAWVSSGAAIETPFVSVPGLLTAECKSTGAAAYLEVTVHADPSDPRADDISGDLTPQWGLHLVDVNLAMGNLLDVVRQQAQAYTAAR